MLTILTLNINGPGTQHGAWDVRIDRIRQVVDAWQPDICAFQAVEFSDRFAEGNQARQLAALLPAYPHVVGERHPRIPCPPFLGQAFLSRWPASEVTTLELSHRDGTTDPFFRIVLHARFDLSDGPLHLINAHFSWVPEQAWDNVQEVVPRLQALTGARLLVGDLNQTPDSESLQGLASQGWEDVWRRLRPREGGATFPADRPEMRIDYAWVPQVLLPQVEGIERVADPPASSGICMSDHLGLLLTARFP